MDQVFRHVLHPMSVCSKEAMLFGLCEVNKSNTQGFMIDDVPAYVERGRKIQRRMASSPCEYIEMAFDAERHALESSGAAREELRAAIQTMDSAETWTDRQRDAFVAWVDFVEARIGKR